MEVIIPFPASGGVDTMARTVMQALTPRLPGLTYAATNRLGAGGQLGFEAAYNARPDGYTLGCVVMPGLATIAIERTPRYAVEKFTYLANIVDDPGAFLVRADSPWKTLDDLKAAALKAPGALSVGTAGVGSDDHLLMMAFEGAAGVKLLHAPYNGSPPILQDLLGGRLALGSTNMSEAYPLLKDGQIRAIGQAGDTRWKPMQGVPTFREQGFDILGGSTRGIVGPPDLRPEIREALITALRGAVADPALVANAEALNMPLRPVFGEEYRAMVLATNSDLHRLWQERPWKE